MTTWYVYADSRCAGPYSVRRLRNFVLRGVLHKASCISQDGESWVYAHEVDGVFQATNPKPSIRSSAEPKSREQRPVPFCDNGSAQSPSVEAELTYFFALSDEHNRNKLLSDATFWTLVVLGVVPLVLGSISRSLQPTAFAVYFAMLWGAIFKTRVIPMPGHWKLLLGTFFFTGIVGMGIVLLLSFLMHTAAFPGWAVMGSPIPTRPTWQGLVYMVVMVGVPEEFCKAIPVCALIACSSKKIDHSLVVLTGIFSGFGFAAFENIQYGQAAGAYFDTAGNAGAWVTLRAMALVFCHGIWSGTVAYLTTTGLSKKRFLRYYLLGIISAGTIHGVYNWLTEVQLTVAAGVIACTWALLYANISKLQSPNQRTTS